MLPKSRRLANIGAYLALLGFHSILGMTTLQASNSVSELTAREAGAVKPQGLQLVKCGVNDTNCNNDGEPPIANLVTKPPSTQTDSPMVLSLLVKRDVVTGTVKKIERKKEKTKKKIKKAVKKGVKYATTTVKNAAKRINMNG